MICFKIISGRRVNKGMDGLKQSWAETTIGANDNTKGLSNCSVFVYI